jgi:hypothetical protein
VCFVVRKTISKLECTILTTSVLVGAENTDDLLHGVVRKLVRVEGQRLHWENGKKLDEGDVV